jgi:hypothetical protein
VLLSIQKSTAKTMPLLIQKSATKNYGAVDSEIDSEKLYRCRFRNWQ